MKRLIALLLILVLLAGCAVQEPNPTAEPTTVPTTEPTQPTTNQTDPPGAPLYIRNSELEQQTGGAVKAYDAHQSSISLYPMGEELLLFFPRQPELDLIQIYGGEELCLRGTARPDSLILPGDRGVQFSDSGISYYRDAQKQIVLLDASLNETDRIQLPAEAQGAPVVDIQNRKAYFCTENELRVLDLDTGIARLLRQQAVEWHAVYDICFDGRVLLCDVIDSNQNGYLAYIDTSNGKLLGKDTYGWNIHTKEDAFLLTDNEGNALYGTWETEVLELTPTGEDYRIWSVLPLGGALTSRSDENGLILDFYTLETGLRTASVTLSGVKKISNIAADALNQCVWFFVIDSENRQTLCRWDHGMSGVEDETVYLVPRYTEENPDADGLNQLQAEADKLAVANGMEIRIWKDAVTAPWENLKADYRVSSFRNTLDMMERVLAAFPEGMIGKLASISSTGVTSVSIVRGEDDIARSYFKWNERSTYIALENGEDAEAAFLEALYRVMDTYLLNDNSILDEWYEDDPVSDRAMIFRCAMSADQAEFFEDEDNWDKLDQLCESIREAFELEDYEGELLWEQYL